MQVFWEKIFIFFIINLMQYLDLYIYSGQNDIKCVDNFISIEKICTIQKKVVPLQRIVR